ncbi:unnamed protein product [Rotaria socialis]|uniref:Uncharacterized protein n=1 Tax=Rotaria socialis TaxID=392032 RepID=A0A820H019_9BILA|nr:unnamed protein product [Rotaria socialis]CAF4287706.1 unnamed protein product [Rotaria socialis]CAF4525675.1 unnamed protein product [Rotaria socialis]
MCSIDLLIYRFLVLHCKRTKLSSVNRLPSLYQETLINSENEYRREINRKLDQLQLVNREVVRRRHAYDHLFAHGHLSKRHEWFNKDKSYREICRTKWNKDATSKPRTSHIFLPSIYPVEDTSSLTPRSFEIIDDESPSVTDEKIKHKFLHVQPVMLEILNAPHSSKIVRHRQETELRKMSAQRRQQYIQRNAIDDPRYRQLVSILQND